MLKTPICSKFSSGGCRILLALIVAGAAATACSGAAGPADDGTGGAGNRGSGGAGLASTGGTNVPATGGATSTGGASSTGGTGGMIGATGTGGATNPQTGGTSGSGGAVDPGTGGVGGKASGTGGGSVGGSTGNGGGSGSGGKPDQGSLPAVTVHMAGDSTMASYASSTTQEGWGQELGQFFISKVTINNQAQGGSNIQAFYDGRWKTLINSVKAGDYVFCAFGINDSGTTHGPVSPQDFKTQMTRMADEVAAKKATFIPTTSSPLLIWAGGKIDNTRLQPYCDATKAVGMEKGLLVDDLNARGIEYFNMVGQSGSNALMYMGDKAHFVKQGATEMARLAAQELKRINSPLAGYLK